MPTTLEITAEDLNYQGKFSRIGKFLIMAQDEGGTVAVKMATITDVFVEENPKEKDSWVLRIWTTTSPDEIWKFTYTRESTAKADFYHILRLIRDTEETYYE